MHIKILTPFLVLCYAVFSCTGGKPETVEKDVNSLIPCWGFSYIQNDDPCEISAPVSGTILTLTLQQGRHVRNGDRLAIIENAD